MRRHGDPLEMFQPAVREWFTQAFSEPTPAQAEAWPSIVGGQSTLLLAPTGSGKTLAAFLAALDGLFFAPKPPEGERLRVLYVSPLKALGVDIERNLSRPIGGQESQTVSSYCRCVVRAKVNITPEPRSMTA